MSVSPLDDRIGKIKNDNEEIARFVEEYKPFIAACVEKSVGRYVQYGQDDELSIGMMAFVEAIKQHDPQKGNFLSFARHVIKRRLQDYYRKEKKHSRVILMRDYLNGETNEGIPDLGIEEAADAFASAELSQYRKLEIEMLKKELENWGINFFQLVKESPKHKKSRKMCGDIIRFMLSNPSLVETMKSKKSLPLAKIGENLGISQKKIERVRKYLIAAIIISTGDYEYLRSFVDWG